MPHTLHSEPESAHVYKYTHILTYIRTKHTYTNTVTIIFKMFRYKAALLSLAVLVVSVQAGTHTGTKSNRRNVKSFSLCVDPDEQFVPDDDESYYFKNVAQMVGLKACNVSFLLVAGGFRGGGQMDSGRI